MKKRKHDPYGNTVAPPTGPDVPPFTLSACARCQVPCWARETHEHVDSPFITMRPATTARGVCAECAAHWWLFTIDGFRWSFKEGPGVLGMPIVQSTLSGLLTKMHPTLDTLDWTRLLAQWNLPWPDDWALPHDTVLENAPAPTVDPARAKAAEENRDPAKRTLTSLYNEMPDWLTAAHLALDLAVFDAYGWPHDLSDDQILARLLALNLERAATQGQADMFTEDVA